MSGMRASHRREAHEVKDRAAELLSINQYAGAGASIIRAGGLYRVAYKCRACRQTRVSSLPIWNGPCRVRWCAGSGDADTGWERGVVGARPFFCMDRPDWARRTPLCESHPGLSLTTGVWVPHAVEVDNQIINSTSSVHLRMFRELGFRRSLTSDGCCAKNSGRA